MGWRLLTVVGAVCGVLALPSSAGAAWPTITTLAGTGPPGFSGDGGPAPAAQVSRPTEAIGLPGGAVLISDYDNDRVRLVRADGVISTFAGTGVQGFSGDGGPAALAQLSNPRDTIRLPDGSILIADSTNERIRRVAADGTITTIAGTGGSGSTGDGGPATSATFSGLRDIALLADGSVLISDQSNARLRRIDTGGIVHAHSVGYATPEGIEQLPDGSVLVADRDGQIVRRVAPDGTLSVFAGAPVGQCIDDLAGPQDVAELPDGSVLVADTFNNRIVRVGPDGGAITVFAGPVAPGDCAPGFEGDGGPRLGARFERPEGVSVTPDGSVLIADSLNHRVRVIPRVPPRPATPITGGPDGRNVTVPVELAPGSTLTGCQVAVRPSGSGAAFVALATSVDPAGECSARPGPQEVPDGTYDLQVQTTDSDDDVDDAVFSVRIGRAAALGSPSLPGLVPPPSFFVPCLDDGVLVTELRQRRDRRVVVAGVARSALVGHEVELTVDGRPAGSARVGEDGGFTAVLPAPAAQRRASVRYRAIVAGMRSPALKLRRRMTVTAGALPDDRVSLSGRVRAPLPTRARGVVRVRRYESCRRARTGTSTRRRRGGRFAVRVERASRPIVYRATTRVPRRTGGEPRFSTFTLFVLIAPRSG